MLRFLSIKEIFLLPACLLILAACKKEGITAYSSVPAIYLTNAPDSVRYSFALQPGFIMEDTIWINARISGDSFALSRPVSLIVAEGTTATAGLHYKLPDYSIPAGKFSVRLPVVVYRTPDLESKEVAIKLQLVANDQFSTPFNTRDYRAECKILLNDILTKPTNWEGRFELRFGKYSLVKYKFMIDVLGAEIIMQFNDATLLINDQLAYRQKVINAWLDEVALHGPMEDENGAVIVF